MDPEPARKLKVGDRVVAVHDGKSEGIVYRTGQIATVIRIDAWGNSWPFLCLDTGEETGRVWYGNWDLLKREEF